jgi:hypothetical protein
LRKSSKDCRADKASVISRLQAEADAAIKAPPVTTSSAIDPPYLFTSSCPDPKRRIGRACAEARLNKKRGINENNRLPNGSWGSRIGK